jgi:oligopeptide/dipeptide ABC transporter ATP-binding protein
MERSGQWTTSTLEVDPAEAERWKLGGEIPSPIDLPHGCYLYSRCPLRDAICADHYPPLTEVRSGHWSACFMVHKIDPTVRVPQPNVTEFPAGGAGAEK